MKNYKKNSITDINIRYKKSVKIIESTDGITLIALVITIIVLLILAGVSIRTVIGENGILVRAENSVEIYNEAEIKENIQLMLATYRLQQYETGITLLEYLNKEQSANKLDKVTSNGGIITVELNGFEVAIDETTLAIVEPNGTSEVIPTFTTTLYQTTGDPIVEGSTYEELIVTVDITNQESLGTINSIIMKDETGAILTAEEYITGNGNASFRISETGTYTIEVISTTNGITNSNSTPTEFLEGGLLGKVEIAVDEHTKAQAKEAVELILVEFQTAILFGEELVLIDHLNTQQSLGKLDKVTQNGNGTITVELNNVKINIDESSADIISVE